MSFDANLSDSKKESIAELYIELLPFLVVDFIHKDDLKQALMLFVLPEQIESIFMATQRLSAIRKRFRSGEDAADIVKPIMEMD